MFSLIIIGESKWLKSCNSPQLNLLNSSFLFLLLEGMMEESINIGGHTYLVLGYLFKWEHPDSCSVKTSYFTKMWSSGVVYNHLASTGPSGCWLLILIIFIALNAMEIVSGSAIFLRLKKNQTYWCLIKYNTICPTHFGGVFLKWQMKIVGYYWLGREI